MLLFHHKTVDGIQGVENEMRVHLGPQCFGFGLSELFLKISRELFFIAFPFINYPADHAKTININKIPANK
jgi:hypothetical protein